VGQSLLVIEASQSHSVTTHNIYKRESSMPPVGFEPTILANELPHTHVLGRASTVIGKIAHFFKYTYYDEFLVHLPSGKDTPPFPHNTLRDASNEPTHQFYFYSSTDR
jgi:hypothetical protein